MLETGEGRGEWLDQARFTLQAAESMLAGGLSEDSITSAFLAMVYAARSALEGGGAGAARWQDVVAAFQSAALPGLGLSKENQRALPVVADLYQRICSGAVEADPVTAAACLEDARSFLAELEAKAGG